MSEEHDTQHADADALEGILETNLGQPDSVADYPRPLTDEKNADLDKQLDSIEQAHAKAAARLHKLYAD